MAKRPYENEGYGQQWPTEPPRNYARMRPHYGPPPVQQPPLPVGAQPVQPPPPPIDVERAYMIPPPPLKPAFPTYHGPPPRKMAKPMDDGCVVNHLKPHKSAMSRKTPGNWSEADAKLAQEAESASLRVKGSGPSLKIQFPDPPLQNATVMGYNDGIQSVHFPVPSTPRYCFVTLKEGADVEAAIKSLEEMDCGFGSARLKVTQHIVPEKRIDGAIDPLRLYLGNLPNNVIIQEVKDFFPKAIRIDVGRAQKTVPTRYCLMRFENVHDAIAAMKRAETHQFGGRTPVCRFSRVNPPTTQEKQDPKRSSGITQEESISDQVVIKKEPEEIFTDDVDPPPAPIDSDIDDEEEDGNTFLRKPPLRLKGSALDDEDEDLLEDGFDKRICARQNEERELEYIARHPIGSDNLQLLPCGNLQLLPVFKTEPGVEPLEIKQESVWDGDAEAQPRAIEDDVIDDPDMDPY